MFTDYAVYAAKKLIVIHNRRRGLQKRRPLLLYKGIYGGFCISRYEGEASALSDGGYVMVMKVEFPKENNMLYLIDFGAATSYSGKEGFKSKQIFLYI